MARHPPKKGDPESPFLWVPVMARQKMEQRAKGAIYSRAAVRISRGPESSLTSDMLDSSGLALRWLFEALSEPDLNDGLPGDTKLACFPIQRFDHPCREIDVAIRSTF